MFKLELAYKRHFPLQGINNQNVYIVHKKDLIDAAAGVEYDANSKNKITLELSHRHLMSGKGGLIPGIDENSTALYITFFNKKILTGKPQIFVTLHFKKGTI